MKNGYLPCVDDLSKVRTQLKNRDDSLNYIFSALSSDIVGSAQDPAQVPPIFFPWMVRRFFAPISDPPNGAFRENRSMQAPAWQVGGSIRRTLPEVRCLRPLWRQRPVKRRSRLRGFGRRRSLQDPQLQNFWAAGEVGEAEIYFLEVYLQKYISIFFSKFNFQKYIFIFFFNFQNFIFKNLFS